ncbi:hypothetical protein APUTEX25_000209 [Auxenochlorella protothecoides]|uniref:Helicase ATP-binding domain-containing protein n=1 Tax=Auxenochlorella protothecoides TaxID=3075 RepID=A0A3M7L2D6_AUXPR|nr:hypothetical protein APUTEX25_000209 [Auxenochlorella protothecoides]|eukprot:RMZ55626.1 hypothetical protein APUTEX25_000209 [Auxenochlorella protothecoides]
MTKVIQALQAGENALLESPTGTGKTLCLLCATLAWRAHFVKEAWAEHKLEQAESGKGELPTVVYASRTHSQLAQVMRELRTSGYRVRSAVLSSRAHTCLHPVVSTLHGQAANRACRSLISRRGCKQHDVERFAKGNPDASLEVLDIEDLVRLGTQRQLCPFLLSKEYATTADILFVPYNYLIDPQRRKSLNISWKNAVLIFDEAHNVESVCSDAASFDLTAGVLAGSIEELGTAAELAVTKGDGGSNIYNEHGKQEKGTNYLQLATELRQAQARGRRWFVPIILKKLEQSIAATAVPSSTGFTAPGAFLFELFGRVNLTLETWPVLAACLEAGVDLLAGDAAESGRRSGARSTSYRLHNLQEALSLAFEAAAPAAPGQPPAHLGYRVYIHREEAKVKAIMLTSGTLSPLASFAAELSIVFPHRLENPHVIDPSQASRASCSWALNCVEGWKLPSSGGTTIWERICRHKAPVVEPRDSAQFVLAVQDFQAKLDGPGTGGAVLFAVCRGKASEGIDFSDRAGRAVIITGIPYANKADAKVRLKQEVLNESLRGRVGAAKRPIGMPGEAFRGPGRPEALSGDQWYVQQAVRAVNQAMGRVIRHKDDYGAVILCDERFKTPNMRNQLSKWLREQTVVFPDYGKAAGSLTTFFRANAGRAREPAAQASVEMGASTARPTAARVESGAPDEAEPSQAGDTGAVVGTTGLSDGRSGADGSISQQPHSAAQPSGPGPPPDPTRPAPHGTSATLPSRELTVKEYMAQLKAGLAPELFRRINAALQAYQASRDREALVASVIATLDRPEQFALLAGFSLFLPKAERAGFRNRIGPAPSADSAWAVPGDGERLPLHDGPPRVALANATNAARPGLGSGTAAGCKVPMSSAYEASCGYLACYACWLGALAKFKCPTCGKGVRKSHLLPKHFV